MNLAQICRFVPYATGVVGALLIGQWLLFTRPAVSSARRLPGVDAAGQVAAASTDLKGFFVKGEGAAGKSGSAWPGFRGPGRDNVSTEKVSLSRTLGGGTVPRVWQVEVGEGYAGATVVDGRVYVLDYDEAGRADVLRCLSSTDGREIWRRGYKVEVGRNHGITRTVCAVSDGRVVTLGPKCHALCVDAADGSLKWSLDLVAAFGATIPPWYTGQNPLIDDGRVIFAPGGNAALLAAVDLNSGKTIWQTSNPNHWAMTHSSVTPVKFGDRKLYVYCASGGVVGVNAQDGSVEFEVPQWKVSMANVPSPLPLPDDRLLFTGGYGAGVMMVKLTEKASHVVPEIVFRVPPEVFGAEQHTPVFYRGFVYGVLPVSSQLCCLSLDGKQVWTSGAKNRFGLGPFLIADGMILALADNGTLNLIEATETGYKPLAKAALFDHGHEAWGPLALSGGRLYARDLTRLACFDLREAVGHE